MKRYFITYGILIMCHSLLAQPGDGDRVILKVDTLFVEKIKCQNDLVGYKLVINESRKKQYAKTTCDYSYTNLFLAKEDLRLKLVEQLLTFENDTTMSCCKVYCYRRTALKHKDSIKSEIYNIQIEALYHINMILFGSFATSYAPYPVLFDVEKGGEINTSPGDIKEVYKIYREWYTENKEKKFKAFSFPLLGTKFRWLFGSQNKNIFNELPVYESDFRFTIGRKVQ